MLNFHDTLKAGYSNDPAKQIRFADKNGYVRDNELSDNKHQVYTKGGHLVYNVNGTNSIADWGTNAMLAVGLGKQSGRFAKEKNTLERARKKHKPTATSISGSSLGGYLASNIAEKEKGDRVTTYNAAVTKVGSDNHYRTALDPVSIGTIGTKHTTTVPTTASSVLSGGLVGQHSTSHLKGKNIFV